MKKSLIIGAMGEQIAVRYLQNAGYEVLKTNLWKRTGYRKGEVDIIARTPKTIIFCEVKTRTDMTSSPEEAVTPKKLTRILRAIHLYFSHPTFSTDEHISWRLDVICVKLNLKNRRASLRHVKSVYY
jgi:putative endonuclease